MSSEIISSNTLSAAILTGVIAIFLFVAQQTISPWLERRRLKKEIWGDLISELEQNNELLAASTYITLEEEAFRRFRQAGLLQEQPKDIQSDLKTIYSRIHEKNELVNLHFKLLTGPTGGKLMIAGGEKPQPVENVLVDIRRQIEETIKVVLPKLEEISLNKIESKKQGDVIKMEGQSRNPDTVFDISIVVLAILSAGSLAYYLLVPGEVSLIKYLRIFTYPFIVLYGFWLINEFLFKKLNQILSRFIRDFCWGLWSNLLFFYMLTIIGSTFYIAIPALILSIFLYFAIMLGYSTFVKDNNSKYITISYRTISWVGEKIIAYGLSYFMLAFLIITLLT